MLTERESMDPPDVNELEERRSCDEDTSMPVKKGSMFLHNLWGSSCMHEVSCLPLREATYPSVRVEHTRERSGEAACIFIL